MFARPCLLCFPPDLLLGLPQLSSQFLSPGIQRWGRGCPTRPCPQDIIICKDELAQECGQPFMLGQLVHWQSAAKENPAQELSHFSWRTS